MSNRFRNAVACAALLALTSIGAIDAAKPPTSFHFSPHLITGIDPAAPFATERRGDARVRSETGQPVALYRVNYRATAGTPEAMAREYLAAHAAQLHLSDPSLGDLEHHGTWSHPAGDTVRFRQYVDGIPVHGPDVAVTINRENVVRFVANGYRPDVVLDELATTVSAVEAESFALELLLNPVDPSFLETVLVVYPGSPARLAWRTRVVPRTAMIGDWEFLLDAQRGELFQWYDRAASVDGNGNVFLPDPLSSAGVEYNDPGFTDGGDANTPELQGQLFNSVLLDLEQSGGMTMLVNPYAEIVDDESPFKGLFAQPGTSFEFNREEDGFEAVNTFFHIDAIMRHFNVALGVPVEAFQYNGGARFDPHGLSGSDNSHYIGSTGIVAFGEGGVDDAEDADVVVHELGHAIHDWVTLGGLSQVNGLSEGFGDYIAASYSRAFGQWLPSDPQYDWVFDWDGHNPFWGGRITDYGGHYPEDLTGFIHTDGQIWSTCNMKIWDAIGRDAIDRAMVTGLGFTNGNTNQEEAAQASLQAAVDLGYVAADIAAMQSIYQDCGYDVEVSILGLETTISGSCPGSIEITVENATPGGRVAFGFSDAMGQTTIPGGSCAGTIIDLDDPTVLTTITADGNGELDLSFNAPSQACGKAMQALDLESCETGNVFQVPGS